MKQKTNRRLDQMNYVNIEELTTVIEKDKSRSASSMFSKRNYCVCKCAIFCDRMMNFLVRYYNATLRHQNYPDRWLDVLDVMLEKGKGNVVNELRVMQIIEAYLQSLMRTFLSLRIEHKIEKEKRLSKYDYGSRKGYSAEVALLDKRLLLDFAKRME